MIFDINKHKTVRSIYGHVLTVERFVQEGDTCKATGIPVIITTRGQSILVEHGKFTIEDQGKKYECTDQKHHEYLCKILYMYFLKTANSSLLSLQLFNAVKSTPNVEKSATDISIAFRKEIKNLAKKRPGSKVILQTK